MRQMPRVDRDIARRNRHIFTDLTFDGKIALNRIRVLKIFSDVQCKRQNRSETRKRARIKTLETLQILRGWRYARRYARSNRSVKDLKSVEKSGRRRTANRQKRRLLLLRAVGDVRVKSDGKQRMVVEHTDCAANDGFTVTAYVPCDSQTRSDIIRVARKTLCNIQSVLRRLNVLLGQRNSG